MTDSQKPIDLEPILRDLMRAVENWSSVAETPIPFAIAAAMATAHSALCLIERERASTVGAHHTALGRFWRPRYLLSILLIKAGMKMMPRSRYRRELTEALWSLNFRVRAHVAALRYGGESQEIDRG